MTDADTLAGLKRLNNTYQMFHAFTADTDPGDAVFLFSAKDNLTSKDFETCCGSRILEGYRPVFDATAIANLRRAGGKLIGKTNMDEFGFGTHKASSPLKSASTPMRIMS
ncbi:MAG: amidase family protein [Candidatus Methanomethylophilus sp.]|nr:amidase family protein [Methanomethylophilus sp.]